MVAAAMEGPVLRYSNRMSLLRAAAGMGIDRFEANLLIALVQHRTPTDAIAVEPRPRRTMLPTLLLVAIEAVAVATWLLLT